MFDQLSKPLHRVIDPLVIAQPQLNHTFLQSDIQLKNKIRATDTDTDCDGLDSVSREYR